ncbi:MAG: hypothetical protein A2068_09465 [Ignavibacteria bacterium GWB2_35_6b]|nr:MAG: hypothetical protein A2068_09465 [Ignavibacteria bacterium GWB2_35_6b]
MCGRYQNKLTLEKLLEILGLDISFYDEIKKRFKKKENIAPADLIISISQVDGKLVLEISNWGIKFKADSPLIFNSRIETIKEKSYWKGLFDKNKCLVPMTGFYEWKKSGKKKIPYKIFLPDEEIFFVPAVSTNINNEKCISLVTTEPNNFMKDIHHRMPVILNKEKVKDFFENKVEDNIDLCKPLNDSVTMEFEEAVL